MTHKITVSTRYPKNLYMFSCDQCDYLFMAEMHDNLIDYNTVERIRFGDISVPHSLFLTPDIELEFKIETEVD